MISTRVDTLRERFPSLAIPVLALLAVGCLPAPSRADESGTSLTTPPRSPVAITGKVRAMWVTRWDTISAYDVRTAIRNCVSLGINRVYFQVRGQADAFYRSTLEPWGEELLRDGKAPDFDPLAVALDEARRQGIELYAWANVLPGWKGDRLPRDRRHVAHRHPDWFLTDRRGRRPIIRGDRYALLNPLLPEVRAHLGQVFGEIARNYEVDGIQLDYIRLLHRDPARGEDVPFDARTLSSFRRRHGTDPESSPRRWDEFRQQAMDRLVAELARTVRAERPGLPISVAAYANLDEARGHLFQDVPRWIRQGWIDEACPMIYTTSSQLFRSRLGVWRREVPASRLVPGVGLYLFRSTAPARDQLALLEAGPERGAVYFSYPSCFISRSPLSLRTQEAADLRAHMRKLVQSFSRQTVLPSPPAGVR